MSSAPHWPVTPVIAIVAPAGFLPDLAALDRAIAFAAQRGWQLRLDYAALTARHQRFVADDATRIEALYRAAEDTEVNVVMSLRGGYGSSRILQQLDFVRLAAGNKLWVGHSDFTALQCGLLVQGGQASLAGPMFATDFGGETVSDFTLHNFEHWLRQPDHQLTIPYASGTHGEYSGLLWGGNLTMLAHLVGSPWLPQIKDGILFLEDCGELPFRLERLLYQLWHAGVLQSQKAILLGDFSGARLTERDNNYDWAAVIAHWQDKLAIPMLSGLPHGHIPDKLSLPIGGFAHLKISPEAYTLHYAFQRELIDRR